MTRRCGYPLAEGGFCSHEVVRAVKCAAGHPAAPRGTWSDSPSALQGGLPPSVIEADDLFSDEEYCISCGEKITDLEGWDGECGNCADITEQALRHRFNPGPFCGKCGGPCHMDEWD